MDLKKLERKHTSLKNIELILEVEKNISFLNIFKLNIQLENFLIRALETKNNLQYITNQYAIKSNLVAASSKRNKRTLWIYLSEKSKYEIDSYKRYEDWLLINKKSEDGFLLIGQRAINFAKNNNLKVVHQALNLSINKLTFLIMQLYRNKDYNHVALVISSNRIVTNYITLLPIADLNLDIETFSNRQIKTLEDLKKMSFYPSVELFVKNEIESYLYYLTKVLFIESSFYEAKNKLVHENHMLKQTAENIAIIKRKINRINMEKQIEEIVLLARDNKFIK